MKIKTKKKKSIWSFMNKLIYFDKVKASNRNKNKAARKARRVNKK